jgi:hypothetical protein
LGLPERDADLLGGCVVLHGALAVEDVARVVVLLALWDVRRRRQQLEHMALLKVYLHIAEIKIAEIYIAKIYTYS